MLSMRLLWLKRSLDDASYHCQYQFSAKIEWPWGAFIRRRGCRSQRPATNDVHNPCANKISVRGSFAGVDSRPLLMHVPLHAASRFLLPRARKAWA